jgi:hypothetical protein
MNNVLMGIPVELPEGYPPYTPGRDFIQVPADCCGQLVWLGPYQVKKHEEQPEWPVLCAICVIKLSLEQGQDPRELNLIPLDLFS